MVTTKTTTLQSLKKILPFKHHIRQSKKKITVKALGLFLGGLFVCFLTGNSCSPKSIVDDADKGIRTVCKEILPFIQHTASNF